MKIRCHIERITLAGMALTPEQRAQLERALHQQLQLALRAGWADAAAKAQDGLSGQAWPRSLRLELAPLAAPLAASAVPGFVLGQSLGQSLGTALSPAAPAATPAASPPPGSR